MVSAVKLRARDLNLGRVGGGDAEDVDADGSETVDVRCGDEVRISLFEDRPAF